MRKTLATVAVAITLVVAAAWARAEEKKQDRPGGARIEAVSITATVQSIDYKTREVVLKGPKGGLTTLIAGDEVKNFGKVKKGDEVTFDYTEGIAVDVQKATEAPKMIESRSINRPDPGKPGGTIESVGIMTARVESVDYKTRKVKLKLPEGQDLEIVAGDQVKRLEEVKKGDEVAVKYMQRLTIKVVTPKKAAKKGK